MKKWFEEKFIPVATRIANSRILCALRDGIVMAMPLMIIGSLFIIISDFPSDAYQSFMAGMFGEGWGDKLVWSTVFPATMSIISLIASFGVAKSLVESYGYKGDPAGVMAIAAYLIVTTFDSDMWGWNADYLGTSYLFSALVISLLAGYVYKFVLDRDLVIKLPESVPPAISGSFTALIPGLIIVVLALIVKFIFAKTPYGDFSTAILTVVGTPLTKAGTSLGGVIATTLVEQILWSFGIHGSNVVSSIMGPIWSNAQMANLSAYQAGQAIPYAVTTSFVENFLWIGGSGATLPLVIWLCVFAKSKIGKQVGRLSLAPGIFNINEPVVFGMPVVLNPFLMIPYICAPLVIAIFTYITMSMNIFPKPCGISINWTIPYFLCGYLTTGGKIGGFILQVINFFIAFVIWWPFVRAWDKEQLKKENGEE
ncbi:MAG: PTS sugar transporter subunit IIC [Erysipelotrichaceae bacterium]|nr:PTS sugar transporter subunit IIC [Erysipelotrichaceae bacterium]